MAVPGLARIADERLPALFKSGGGISYNEVEHGVTCGVCRELVRSFFEGALARAQARGSGQRRRPGLAGGCGHEHA